MTDNKVDLTVEACEDCFRVVGKNGNKGGQRVSEDALTEYFCQVLSCNGKYGV